MAAERVKKLMQGNEACAEGALYAGCEFYAGYPITPSTEIGEILSYKLPLIGGKFIQMEDEIGGMAATIGGSLAGKKSLTATSGPGLSLKQECIGFAAMAEVPCVIINVTKGGPSTGYPTGPSQSDLMATKWGTHGDHPVIAVTPSYVPEIFTETVRAFNLAEKYRTPVFVLFDEIIGHMREVVTIPLPGELEVINRAKTDVKNKEDYLPYDNRFEIPPLAPFGEGYRYHVTGLNHDEDGFPTNDSKKIAAGNKKILTKIENNKEDIWSCEEVDTEDAEVLVFAFGEPARSASFAVREARKHGVKAGLLRPLTIWPFPDEPLRKAASKAKVVIVPELNLGQSVLEVERSLPGVKVEGIHRVDGEPITPAEILAVIDKHK